VKFCGVKGSTGVDYKAYLTMFKGDHLTGGTGYLMVSDKMFEGILGHFHRDELTGGGIGSGGLWWPTAPELMCCSVESWMGVNVSLCPGVIGL
jgi:hypothetical protein